jgi:hypothetical protein
LSPEDDAIKRLQADYIRLNNEKQRLTATTKASTGSNGAFNPASILNFAAAMGMLYTALNVARTAWSSFIEPAMQAEEATSKFQTIFGSSSSSVTAWADQLSVSIGRSSRELRSMAADMMAVISPMAQTRAAAERMSEGLVEIAQDLSSFHNTSVDDAFAALRSAMTGETEPMKRFGIILTDAALNEYALAQGIRKRVEQMSTAEKTQLRYNAIVSMMGEAHGDAARTSGSLTNQLRALEGKISDIKVATGERAIPGVTDFVRGLNALAEESKHNKGLLDYLADGLNHVAGTIGRGFQVSAIQQELRRFDESIGRSTEVVDNTKQRLGIDFAQARDIVSTELGRIGMRMEVLRYEATQLGDVLDDKYGTIDEALRHSTDSQVVQYNRIRDEMRRTVEAGRRFGVDLSNGIRINNLNDVRRQITDVASIMRTALNPTAQTTPGGTRDAQTEAARQRYEQRVAFEQQWLDRAREFAGQEQEMAAYQMEWRLGMNEIEYERALAQAAKHHADRTAIDAYFSGQRMRIEREETEKRSKQIVEYSKTMVSNMHSAFSDLLTTMQNFGHQAKALVITVKVLAMAEAAINSYLAFTQVLRDNTIWPTWARIPIAATILAAGLAKQAAIASTPISAETGITSYTVPNTASYGNDRAPVYASAGEHVTVTPRGEDHDSQTIINLQVGEEVIYRVVQKGFNTGKINVNNKNIGKSVFM